MYYYRCTQLYILSCQHVVPILLGFTGTFLIAQYTVLYRCITGRKYSSDLLTGNTGRAFGHYSLVIMYIAHFTSYSSESHQSSHWREMQTRFDSQGRVRYYTRKIGITTSSRKQIVYSRLSARKSQSKAGGLLS